MTARLIDSLYVEAMLLADEARSYFDDVGRRDRDTLAPLDRVTFSCESLKVTTRLMHIIAWLLHRKALAAGEIDRSAARGDACLLGRAAGTDAAVVAAMPGDAAGLIGASIDLYERIARIDREVESGEAATSPARSLMSRLERAF